MSSASDDVSHGELVTIGRCDERDPVTVYFNNCRLDLDARRLFQGRREIRLSPKAFELLKLLVESRPRALSKAELLERVWPGVFVSDASLTRVVNEIRKAIGDRARQGRFVRTVHGYGYAFGGDIEVEKTAEDAGAAHQPTCWLICGNRTIALPDGTHIAGREPDARVWLDSPKISRRHASIAVTGMRAMIEDLRSKNGTFVRGVRISTATDLDSGDEVRIGPFTLVFQVTRAQRPTETETIQVSTVKPQI